MKTNKLGMFLVSLLLSITMYSQEIGIECIVEGGDNAHNTSIYSGSIDPEVIASYDPVVYNIYFWVINKSDGTNDRQINEADVLRNVARLNKLFNKLNVFFKYHGYDDTSYNSTDHYAGSQLYYIRNYAQQNGLVAPNSFNVYVCNSLVAGAGESAYNTTSLVVNSYHFLQVATNDNAARILNHEIAHNFYIKHTRSSTEHVTRDPDDTTNFNALSAGDRVLDTAANPGYRDGLCSPASDPLCYPYLIGCEYDPNSPQDDQSDPPVYYRNTIYADDIANVMSDSPALCRDPYFLSVGQQIRIRETIDADINNVFGGANGAETTVASLYEPYKGEYYLAGPDQDPHDAPLFQPGFEYRFVECNGDYPQPSEYSDISFNSNNGNIITMYGIDENNYASITHPNHTAILIKHEIGTVFYPQARKCYDNWNKKPSGGSVTKFNDGVLNTNVTITLQDSTAINNHNLIQNLDNGLYKIEKIYNDGSVQETIIINNNN